MKRPTRSLLSSLICLVSLAFALPVAAEPPAAGAPAALEREEVQSRARRLTTAERWRGKPYLRTASRERAALPILAPGEGTGAKLAAREDELLREQALDKPLPLRNPAFVGAIPAFRGIEADPIRRLSLDQRLPFQGPGFGQAF